VREIPALATTTRPIAATSTSARSWEVAGHRADRRLEAHEHPEHVPGHPPQRLGLARVRDDRGQQRDDHPQQQDPRVEQVGPALRDAGPERHERGHDHRQRQTPAAGEPPARARGEQDVARPAHGGAQGEQHARGVELLPRPRVGEQQDAGRRERDPRQIEAPLGGGHRHGERAGELDRDRYAERDAVDRLVEQEVHQPEDEPEDDREHEIAARVGAGVRPPDGDQEHGGEAQAQERHAAGSDVVEERDAEGGPELDRGDADEDECQRRDPAHGFRRRPV
jgi:hypothetical protein